MAARKQGKKRKTERKIKVAVNCMFCKGKTDPSYKEYETLSKFLSERAKILGSARTGICTKHQRRLSIALKRARHLGLLPFTPSL